jgi:hypothetical protein
VTVTLRGYAAAALLVALAIGTAACGGSANAQPAGGTSSTSPTVAPPSRSARLVAPKTTAVQDARYLTDVAKADPDLATYVQQRGNTALKAMLTDGTAFCAFLARGGGIDNALLAVVIGARGEESQTHLPAKVATFNTLEAVALLDLCPSGQSLVPPSVRTKIHRLGQALRPPSA